MSLDVTWKIKKMEWDEDTGGVLSISWAVEVSDGEQSVDTPGTSRFSPEAYSPAFIPLDSLTEQKAIEWVKTAVYMPEKVEERAIKRFNESTGIVSVVSGIPWS
jgi:hypothetical protein